MKDVPKLFGTMVFNDAAMQQTLPADVYKKLKKTINDCTRLDNGIAACVANAMKDWAISKGATHYTHWFQPLTGVTAEKHDSFISPQKDGSVIMEFSGKELIRGESDASSFPSGGLRATFEARGYTAWDPSSYAFVKDDALYIPTVFCSYSGEALDEKTPLLRSMDAMDLQAKRILKLFGKDVSRVIASVGPEQEYFLVDKKDYVKRKDLIFTGRTLFGARPPKGQEMDDHYFGSIRTRVKEYMADLDEELWKLGVLAKTKHNEAAPAQHELAPIYSSTNIATDHNQLIMETMKKVAERHDLVCLLHEKPFEGVNGSGKHNNWSFSANGAGNLLDPGASPHDNAQFLLFLCAVIKAVDEYQELLRISVASAGNDHRLGANEAPPAIISMYLGDELTEILSAITHNKQVNGRTKEKMTIGVDLLPVFPKDTSDRNRTSPFAFTGNKFEFRMPGAAQSVAGVNTVLNTIVAESLCQFADHLENCEDYETALGNLITETVKKHERIIFNGNNYSEEWVQEAAKRGLSNLPTTADCLPHFVDQKNIDLFTKHKVYTAVEMHSRLEIMTENYSKVLNIEALTMATVAKGDILPAVMAYSKELAETVLAVEAAGADATTSKNILGKITTLIDCMQKYIKRLENALIEAQETADLAQQAKVYGGSVSDVMFALRTVTDELETMVPSSFWPMPTYADLLFYI